MLKIVNPIDYSISWKLVDQEYHGDRPTINSNVHECPKQIPLFAHLIWTQEEEERDRASEGSEITDDSENWDMTRGNLGLLEQAIALKAGEGRGQQDERADYLPYHSPSDRTPTKPTDLMATARRSANYSKGRATYEEIHSKTRYVLSET